MPTINDTLWQQAQRLGAAVRRRPWWLQITLIYLAARFVSYGIFEAVSLHQGASPWGPAHPDYLHFVGIWDSTWYKGIFDNGYPQTIPRDAAGVAQQNPWAFFPLYPLLVRGLSAVTGLGWLVLAPTVSLLAGLGAALVIYRLFRRFASVATAMWGVVFFVTFPISPVLQVPYAEALSTLLLASALYLLVRQRYLWAVPVVLLMCLSRPAGVPFAAVVLVHLLLRLFRRKTEPVRRPELLRGMVLLLVSGLSAVAWPLIAWAATGEMKAYTDTETAWRGSSLVLVAPWFDTGRQLFGPVLGLVAPVILVLLFALSINSRAVRTIGTDLQLWCVAYFGYIIAVLQPQTSTFRMLLPLFPLALAAALVSRSRAYRVTVVALFILLQIVWVTWLWAWAQLPGGGDYPP
ncbi:hypothetical protein [Paenarthrobacter sp. PH39-S1]|uniref:hypothetical protein n=1 Tax=Paenarthrobacter sp. PH39-S1 TaxID=3046204 RepID=UPI0024B98762|nr:hypothetical protein [Paenarthrobacter sp. PH39-S1]MDJ0355628.1 hypothetical protein [Paenarthrobacter sp. PH39-S1]